jgi:hypothetical protein
MLGVGLRDLAPRICVQSDSTAPGEVCSWKSPIVGTPQFYSLPDSIAGCSDSISCVRVRGHYPGQIRCSAANCATILQPKNFGLYSIPQQLTIERSGFVCTGIELFPYLIDGQEVMSA